MKTMMMPDEWYTEKRQDHLIDLGIRFPLRVLHAAGVSTNQSCEGGNGHAYHVPTIDLDDEEGTGLVAVAALRRYGIEVSALSRLWLITDGMPSQAPIWRVELRRAYPERADDVPMFVHGYVAT
jgi:hypothetical protein